MLSWSGEIRGPRHPAVTITRRSGWYSAPIVLLHSTELPYICLSSTIQRSVLAVAQADGMPAHSGGNLWTLPLLCSWFLQIVFHQFIRQFHSMYNVHTLPMANAHFITVAMNVIISPEAHSWIGSAIDFRDVGRKVWKLFWKFDGTSGKKGVRHRENELLKKLESFSPPTVLLSITFYRSDILCKLQSPRQSLYTEFQLSIHFINLQRLL